MIVKKIVSVLNFVRGITSITHNWLGYALFFLGINPSQTFIAHLRNGLYIKIRRGGGDMIAVFEDFFEHQYFPEKILIPRNLHTVIDIGSHIGTFSFLVHLVTHGKVTIYDYEPIEENYTLLIDNMNRNNILSIRPHNQAVWKNSKNQRINIVHNSFLGSSITNKAQATHYEIVSCITLKQIFTREKIRTCDLMKIDVEGAEYEILFHTPKALFSRIRAIYVEYHYISETFATLETKLVKFLHKQGYYVYRFTGRPILYAVRRRIRVQPAMRIVVCP